MAIEVHSDRSRCRTVRSSRPRSVARRRQLRARGGRRRPGSGSRFVRVHAEQLIEACGERFGNRWQLDQQEVARRRFTVGAARFVELSVEFGEELLVDTDRPTSHWRAWRPSVAAIRASALHLAASIRSAGTLVGSFTNPARIVAARSSGVSASSSAADQIRSTSISRTVAALLLARSDNAEPVTPSGCLHRTAAALLPLSQMTTVY